MIGRDELYARRCVLDLVFVIEQIPLRAAVRSPLALDHVSIRWVALWTLLRWERNFLLRGLEGRGVDLWKLGCELDDLIDRRRKEDASLLGHAAPAAPISAVPDVRVDHLLYPLLDQAAAQARQMGHGYVGAEHLLLAIVAGADVRLSEILSRHGLTTEAIEDLLKEALPQQHGDEVPVEIVGEPYGQPAGTRWESQAVGVPRRFGMAITMLIMTMYAVLFAAMKLLDFHPIAFVIIAVFFTGVGLGQMLLFRGRNPRAASIWAGAVLLPAETLVTWIVMIVLHAPPRGLSDAIASMFCSVAFSIPLGAAAGYVAGCLTAGVFFVLERAGRRRASVEPDVDVLGVDAAGDEQSPEVGGVAERNPG